MELSRLAVRAPGSPERIAQQREGLCRAPSVPFPPELSEHARFGEQSTARALCHVGIEAGLVLIPAAAADFDSNRFRLVRLASLGLCRDPGQNFHGDGRRISVCV